MLGKILCVLGGVVLGYVAREEINEVVENVMDSFNGQKSSDSVSECSTGGEESHSEEIGEEKNREVSSPSMA